MTRWIVRLLIAVVVVAAGGYYLLVRLRPVVVVEPVRRGVAVDAPSGTVTVFARVSPVVAEVDGRILSSNLRLGAAVKAGDELVQIDSSALVIQINRLENDLAAARQRREIGSPRELDLANARAALAAGEGDFKRGVISANDLETLRRAEVSADKVAQLERVRLAQDVANLENELDQARHRLERMKIVAGIDGDVVAVLASETDRVAPGVVLAQINSRERLVEMQVREEQVARLGPGQKARVQFQPYPLERFDGVIEQILPPLDANSQRYRVMLKVQIAPERLLHGMTGEAFVVIAQHDDALIVPRAAVQDGRVFIVSRGRAERRAVKVGFVSIHEVEIVEGLAEGERVVVENLDGLRDGVAVNERMRRPAQ